MAESEGGEPAFDTSWDITKYKYDFELEKHWRLKEKFFETNKDKLPENLLSAYAQTFYNNIVLGCEYDEEVLEKIKEMSVGILEELGMTENKSETHVQASAAVESRYERKRTRPNHDSRPSVSSESADYGFPRYQPRGIKRRWEHLEPEPIQKRNRFNQGYSQDHGGSSSSSCQDQEDSYRPDRSSYRSRDPPRRVSPPRRRRFDHSPPTVDEPTPEVLKIRKLMTNGPLSQLVLFESDDKSPYSVLESSLAKNKMDLFCSFEGNGDETNCKIYLDKIFVASAAGKSKSKAQQEAASLAVTRLKEVCFCVKVKPHTPSKAVVTKKDLEKADNPEAALVLDSSNKGAKLMSLMGWSEGQGLGKDMQGIKEPVKSTSREFENDIYNVVWKFLNEFVVRKDLLDEVVFAKDFNREEREMIHKVCSRIGLASKSKGKEPDRQLVVNRKTEPKRLVEELANKGGETDRFKLFYPQIS